jgi:hypothetical protein
MVVQVLLGGCRCGAVRYEVRGNPTKVGLCHCTECRRETGSAFLAYADWPREMFTVAGEFVAYEGRSFCPTCGSRLFHLDEDEAEICIGSLDIAPTSLGPVQEGWTIRREHWLPPVEGAKQAEQDP